MKVVLYTGGLDSYIGLWLLRKATGEQWIPIYFDLNSRYSWKERNVIEYLDGIAAVRVIKGVLNLEELEQADSYVPQRNTLLCAAVQAVYDGAITDIALCSVADDVYRDNDVRFHLAMSELLTGTAGYPVRVFSPLQKDENIFGIHELLTKKEAVKKYLELGGDAAALRRTISCYDSRMVSCGRCKACERHNEALLII